MGSKLEIIERSVQTDPLRPVPYRRKNLQAVKPTINPIDSP